MNEFINTSFTAPVAAWYFITLLLGFITLPLSTRLFKKHFWDFGYPFSKIIGIIILSYTAYLLGILKILPFTKANLFILVFIFFLINLKSYKKIFIEIFENKKFLWVILVYEALFFLSIFFWAFVRGQNPDILGLEKFMDFGFINSILKSEYFPPRDIWLISTDKNLPYYINYYYFGHLITALLIKLSGVPSHIGYNLMVALLFALGITLSLSLSSNFLYLLTQAIRKKISHKKLFLYGLFASLVLNLGGNLQIIYIFTKGYDFSSPSPPPFWSRETAYSFSELINILSRNSFNPFSFLKEIIQQSNYWYPNATRFIPFTIHEFPSYSYVVADLHGHLLNIPTVLLILALILLFFGFSLKKKFTYLPAVLLGSLIGIAFMTNATDGPVYLGLSFLAALFLLRQWNIVRRILFFLLVLLSFVIFTLPFNYYFIPFVKGIGINCPPDLLKSLSFPGDLIVIEPENCQRTPLWMFSLIWGYLLFTAFTLSALLKKIQIKNKRVYGLFSMLAIFSFLLIIFAEFFYFKDIYPGHFRANTLFKLGYQAFIICSLLTAPLAYLLFTYKNKKISLRLIKLIFISTSTLVLLYPFFAIPSNYGDMKKQPILDGRLWLKNRYPEDFQIINYLNTLPGQPNILEANGDSYTEYERISAYTGFPTIAGWLVHEWLWRGKPDYVANRQPDIQLIYQIPDPEIARKLLQKYDVKYIIVSTLEYQKYPELNLEKFYFIADEVFVSDNKKGRIFRLK